VRSLIFIILINIVNLVSANELVEYDWLTMGEKTGSQIVKYKGNSITIDFEFNDRGMGPKLHDVITLTNNGYILTEKISGKTYMGAPVDETFSFSNKTARWKNSLENEEKTLYDNNAFYIAANGTPQSLELLISAIENSESQSVNLLPSGIATIEKLKSIQLNNGSDSKNITLYALFGLGYIPDYVWLDSNKRLFALGYGSMGMIVKGWANKMNKLQAIQDEISTNFLANKSIKLTDELHDITLINNVNIFNSIDNYLHKNKQVIIQDGKIIEINSIEKIIKDAQIIDGTNKTLMAGLWDMHTHTKLEDGILNIASGITNVRDVGNVHDDLMSIKNSFDTNNVIGPNIYPVGLIDKKEESSAPTGRLAETIEQALSHVDWYAEQGYAQIKLYSSINPEWIKPITEYAHKKNMKVSGHIPALTNAEYAVKNGFDEIHHMNMIFRNFIVDENEDYRNAKFTLVGERAGTLDLTSDEVTEFISLLKERNITVDPTLTIFQSLYLNKAGQIDPSYKAVADNLPTTIRRDYLLTAMLDINDKNENAYSKTAAAFLTLTKMMYDAGINIVAGTDSMAGFTLHRELELLSESGIPNAEVLKIATIKAAQLNGLDNIGSVKVDNDADLILVEGNPLQNISDIRKISLVIKNNKKYIPNELFKAIGVIPFLH
jgi:cytosine/adenosine deaminase-related metal-dependent hydrolase